MIKLKWIFTIVGLGILLVAVTLSLLLFFIIINKGIVINQNNVDWFDMLIKSSFTLLGSTLSGFIAILVFYLNYLREKRGTEKNSKKYRNLIAKEFNNNKLIFAKISNTLKSKSSEEIAGFLLTANSPVLELFVIANSKITNEFFDSNIQELSEDDYLMIIEHLTVMKSCVSTLKLITSGITSSPNLTFLIDQFKTDLLNLENLTIIN